MSPFSNFVLLLFVFGACTFTTSSNDTDSNSKRRLEEPPGKYHHRMYGYNASEPGAHKKAWMALETVDGLKNEDVVMLVTSTTQKQFTYLRERYP